LDIDDVWIIDVVPHPTTRIENMVGGFAATVTKTIK
jgi:hypothetical protein